MPKVETHHIVPKLPKYQNAEISQNAEIAKTCLNLLICQNSLTFGISALYFNYLVIVSAIYNILV